MRPLLRHSTASILMTAAAHAAGLEPGVASITSGGGGLSSGSFQVQAVVGQAVVDFSGSAAGGTTLRVQSGLWAQFAATLNSPPVGSLDTLDRPLGSRVVKVLASTLLSNDTDADGDVLGIQSVGTALPAGSTVVLSGAFVVYTAPTGNAGPGSFDPSSTVFSYRPLRFVGIAGVFDRAFFITSKCSANETLCDIDTGLKLSLIR